MAIAHARENQMDLSIIERDPSFSKRRRRFEWNINISGAPVAKPNSAFKTKIVITFLQIMVRYL